MWRLNKEHVNVAGIGSGSQIQWKSWHVHQIAQKALERLKNMPPTSYKWTWGEALTQDEVLDPGGRPSHRVHSGYNVSLREGQIHGIPSSTNTAPMGLAKYSILHPNSNIPPHQPPNALQSFLGNPNHCLPYCQVWNPFISPSRPLIIPTWPPLPIWIIVPI